MQRIEFGHTRADNIVVKDVLEFYSPNILRQTQHTNVLFDRRRGGGRLVCIVRSTQYSGHCTLVLCVDPDCDACVHPPALCQILMIATLLTPTLSLKVTDCCLYFA